jgi:hypothetical protein
VTTVEGNGSSAMTIPVILTVTGSAPPTITSVTPNSGQAGQTLTSVAIVGQNTNFVQGTTAANFGAGITVNSLTVTSATTATASISIAANAAGGARTVTLTTGTEVATLANGFTVTSGPTITSVTPNSGQAGQTVASVAIVGQNTNFVQGTTAANFGAGITVNSLTVTSATTATANISIAANAVAGARNVTLTTGAEMATLANGFSVTAPLSVVSFRVLYGSQVYDMTASGASRVRLPWQISGIQVEFSQPVTSGNASSLGGIAATGLTGLGTSTLTWAIAPVSQGNISATLAGSGPNALIANSGATLGGGAGFAQTLRVLFGDFNDDGVVSASDLVGVNNAIAAVYTPFADLNGDGAVTILDVQIVRTRIGTSLP